MEKENIIMQYIASWGWHLSGLIFLASAFTIFFSGENLGNMIMFIAFVIAWVISEFIAYNRKGKIFYYDATPKDSYESIGLEEPKNE